MSQLFGREVLSKSSFTKSSGTKAKSQQVGAKHLAGHPLSGSHLCQTSGHCEARCATHRLERELEPKY